MRILVVDDDRAVREALRRALTLGGYEVQADPDPDRPRRGCRPHRRPGHGPGFQEEDLPHVFERFYRADRARKLPGSGLGLAIVRQAAETHQGYVKAENATGGGALMTVSFGQPLRAASALTA